MASVAPHSVDKPSFLGGRRGDASRLSRSAAQHDEDGDDDAIDVTQLQPGCCGVRWGMIRLVGGLALPESVLFVLQSAMTIVTLA